MHSSHKSVSEHWLSEEGNQTDRQTDSQRHCRVKER
jgi:hypothetical protein